jgi:hypothetical protein
VSLRNEPRTDATVSDAASFARLPKCAAAIGTSDAAPAITIRFVMERNRQPNDGEQAARLAPPANPGAEWRFSAVFIMTDPRPTPFCRAIERKLQKRV